MKKQIQILDIIVNKHDQIFLLLDRMPELLYIRKDSWLGASDSGFYKFYYHHRDPHAKAFAGRTIHIPLLDGTIIEATGQWWDGIHPDYTDLKLVGVGSFEKLRKCYVFCGYKVRLDIIQKALSDFTPSNNYYRYDIKSKNYGIHTL